MSALDTEVAKSDSINNLTLYRTDSVSSSSYAFLLHTSSGEFLYHQEKETRDRAVQRLLELKARYSKDIEDIDLQPKDRYEHDTIDLVKGQRGAVDSTNIIYL